MSDETRHTIGELGRALVREARTLHLATVGVDGTPEASYAPFVIHDGAFFVHLSALASHVANLRASPRAGVLLIRDESACEELFARPRLGARCHVHEEPRGSACWEAVLDAFERRFGETAAAVRTLADFGLFRLDPLDGRVVAGFAQARRLDAAALVALLQATPATPGG
jgi:putative heme iron utilization protein